MNLRKFLRTRLVSTNLIYIDYWSFVHFFVGVLLAKLGFSLTNVIFILLAFEIWENFIQKNIFRGEPFIDFVWDMIAGIAGYLIIVGL